MNKYITMLAIYFTPVLIGGAVAFYCYKTAIAGFCLVNFYESSMRGSLFSGFLTIGGFLLSLKTGILIKIKEGIYDKEYYKNMVSKAKANGFQMTVYGPLRRLSMVLSTSVFACLITAALQFTLGLTQSVIAISFCLGMAALTITLLLESYIFIQINLKIWFDQLERDS